VAEAAGIGLYDGCLVESSIGAAAHLQVFAACCRGHGPSIHSLRHSSRGVSGFHVAFDVIASGDEDVVSSECAQAIRNQTGAACVAWEGSGAARAALFNGIGPLEIRAVTDAADKETPWRFDENLPIAMSNLASLMRLWLEWSRNHSEHLLRGSWR
jgi:nucleoside phosphorylase